MQATEQQGINHRFESIMHILQSIQSSQHSASKRTRGPTTNIDPLPDHKKPASTPDPSLDLDPIKVSFPHPQHHPAPSLTDQLSIVLRIKNKSPGGLYGSPQIRLPK